MTLNLSISTVTNNSIIDAGTGVDTVNLTLALFLPPVFMVAMATTPSFFLLTDNGSNLFDAGSGVDTVFFQSAEVDTISGSTVLAGAGNDSIPSVLCRLGSSVRLYRRWRR